MTKRQLARERLKADATVAVEAAIARVANGFGDTNTRAMLLRTLMEHRSELVEGVLCGLRRNWRITERGRGETTL